MITGSTATTIMIGDDAEIVAVSGAAGGYLSLSGFGWTVNVTTRLRANHRAAWKQVHTAVTEILAQLEAGEES